MIHPFIENYFKNNLDSIKNFHNKIKKINNLNQKNNDIHIIYFEDNDYYVIKNNDISTSKHITMFSIPDILNMHTGPNVNKTNLENFILSII